MIRSLTKTWGVAGLRAGYVVGDTDPGRTGWPAAAAVVGVDAGAAGDRGGAHPGRPGTRGGARGRHRRGPHRPRRAAARLKLLTIELDREEDGRWIADVPDLPGVMVYGNAKQDALAKVQALALRVLASKIEEDGTPQDEVRFVLA